MEKISTKFTCAWRGYLTGCTCPVVLYNQKDFEEHLEFHTKREKFRLNDIISYEKGIYKSDKDYFVKLLEICTQITNKNYQDLNAERDQLIEKYFKQKDPIHLEIVKNVQLFL